jgi:hypothetical protein
MILIVANEFDPHADAVILALKRRNFDKVLRIDFETAHERFDIDIIPASAHLTIRHRSDVSRYTDSREIKTVWWRRSGFYVNRQELDMPTVKNLDRIETYWALRWFIEALPGSTFPFSHPNRMAEANNKMLQLRIAADLGFVIPSTLYTNNEPSLRGFLNSTGKAVLKPLRSSLASDDAAGRTINLIARPITSNDVDAALKGEAVSAFCQARVEKVADVRVNILPAVTIGCEIAAGELPDTEVDYRPLTSSYTHTIIPVPGEIDLLCRKFIRTLDLDWGIFDFGLTANGQWVFFECNPNAQWLWIEFQTGIALSELVADQLELHHNARP